jgi:hypothetical protein
MDGNQNGATRNAADDDIPVEENKMQNVKASNIMLKNAPCRMENPSVEKKEYDATGKIVPPSSQSQEEQTNMAKMRWCADRVTLTILKKGNRDAPNFRISV